MKFLKNW